MDEINKIRLLAAVPTQKEAGPLLESFPAGGPDVSGFEVHLGAGVLAGCALVITGIGMVNAALALALCLERLRPRAVIVAGSGGGYPESGIKPGDIAVASSEVYGDTGVLAPGGWLAMEEIGLPVLKKGAREFFNEFPVEEALVKRAEAAAAYGLEKTGDRGAKVVTGPLVTVSQVTGTDERAKELYHRFRGICENMEGAAAAHVCAASGVPFLELRGISNLVEARDTSKWDIPKASQRAAAATVRLIEQWKDL